MALTTIARIKADYLNIGAGDTTYDTQITNWLAAAESIAKDICGQPLAQETVTHEWTTRGGTTYVLPYVKVPVTLTSLHYRDEQDDSYTSITGAVVYKADGMHSIFAPNAFANRWYKATCAVGYISTDAPASLVNVISEMVHEMYKSTDYGGKDNRFGISSVATTEGGTTSTTVLADMSKKFRTRLMPWKVRGWL